MSCHHQISIPIAVHIAQSISQSRYSLFDTPAQHRKTRFSEQCARQPGLHGQRPGLQFPQQQLFGPRQLNPIDFDKGRMIGQNPVA